jgi:hypothetical protein
MANKQSMIQVAGTTYRIQAGMDRHWVFRISDDRMLGAFQHRAGLRVVESEVAPESLLDVAKAALRMGRLPWTRAELPSRAAVQRADHATRARTRSTARAFRNLLMVLWPNT